MFNYNKALKLIQCIIICELAGVFGSVFTTPAINGWYSTINKPSFNPPNWIFGPVWTILFILMGISLYLVWEKKWQAKNVLTKNTKTWNEWSQNLWTGKWSKINIILIFSTQLILNVLWSIVFFGMQSSEKAFAVVLCLWVAILFTILNFYRVSKLAAYLLIPYLLWVSFAGVLNLFIVILN